MAQRARYHNSKNHERQLKENRAKAKYNWGMMIINANADKIREEFQNNRNEGEN
jgi:hypothetical protein